MSTPVTPHYADSKGAIVYDFNGDIAFAAGNTVPSDGATDYGRGCVFLHQDGSAGDRFLINEGTSSSADFNALTQSGGSFANATLTGNTTVNNANIATMQSFVMANNAAITANNTRIGTNNNNLLGFYGATPIVQPAGTGELVGFTGNGATNANAVNFTANGNVGTKAYSLGDVVKALKNSGIMAAS